MFGKHHMLLAFRYSVIKWKRAWASSVEILFLLLASIYLSSFIYTSFIQVSNYVNMYDRAFGLRLSYPLNLSWYRKDFMYFHDLQCPKLLSTATLKNCITLRAETCYYFAKVKSMKRKSFSAKKIFLKTLKFFQVKKIFFIIFCCGYYLFNRNNFLFTRWKNS